MPTAHDESLGFEVLLRSAFDMGRFRRVVEFLVALLIATETVVLFPARHGVEHRKVMQPLLHSSKAGAVDTRAQPLRYGCLDGGFILGIFSTVFVTGQITAILMTEADDRLRQSESRCNQRLQGVTSQQQIARLVATQPQP